MNSESVIISDLDVEPYWHRSWIKNMLEQCLNSYESDNSRHTILDLRKNLVKYLTSQGYVAWLLITGRYQCHICVSMSKEQYVFEQLRSE